MSKYCSLFKKFFLKKENVNFFILNKKKTYVMLEPSPTPISCIVLNVWMNVCMHDKEERDGKVWPQGGGSGGGQIGPSIATQSKLRGLSRNPPLTTSFFIYSITTS